MGGWCEGPALSVNRICYDETTGPEMRIADFLVMLLPSKRGIWCSEEITNECVVQGSYFPDRPVRRS
jgi:hypothetical protein